MYFVLRNFSEVDNNFKDLFADIHPLLKGFLFVEDSPLSQKYRIREGISFKKATTIIDKQFIQEMEVEKARFS